MNEQIDTIQRDAAQELSRAGSPQEREQWRVKYLGRKGVLVQLFQGLAQAPAEERPALGQRLNELKKRLADLFSQEAASVVTTEGARARFDVTMPGAPYRLGHQHLVYRTMREICEIFTSLGFSVVEGPEIEDEFHNFEALNIPLQHPSRDSFDTFYVGKNALLRSHTSPVQIRYMQQHTPPFLIAVPGKVFRPDATDASHSFMFHQVEGLAVSGDMTFADLKGVLTLFARRMFGERVRMRFRPHFFPFTEPSAEADISCFVCGGKGCRLCSRKGWLEILGAGMVHPNVFRAVGYDWNRLSGFAFGMGVERIALLKHGIDDIRLLYENDIRFLNQF